jgi:hypothetical protein
VNMMSSGPDTPIFGEDEDLRELMAWWSTLSQQEALGAIPKGIEYGSRDLVEMGGALLRIAGQEATEEAASEVGIWFYVLGKMGRWTAAVERGERVSDDTLNDIAVYVKMAQRIRQHGGWPR